MAPTAAQYVASGDTTSTTGFWKAQVDAVIDDGKKLGPAPNSELKFSFQAVLQEEEVKVPESTRPIFDGVPEAIIAQRGEVKRAFADRKEVGKPCEPNAKGSVKHVNHFDDTKLLRQEAEMARKFNDKVAPPKEKTRDARVKEMRDAVVEEFCRGNELFDKKDYEAALAEYALASRVEPLRLFAMLNRGNALKALGRPIEAAACYSDVLDEAAAQLSTHTGRLLFSFASNNLGAADQDLGRLEHAIQSLGEAVSVNPRCHLAIRNRANLHMQLAEQLASSEQPSLLPPQHELALGFYSKAFEEDHHLPVVFRTEQGVLVRVEPRITSDLEEPAASILRNTVYHFTSNLTHVTSKHV